MQAQSEIVSHLVIYCLYVSHVFQIIKENMLDNNEWNKSNLEDYVKDWLMDRAVKLYASLPSILINNLWWAHNTNIFKEKLVPLEVTVAPTIR